MASFPRTTRWPVFLLRKCHWSRSFRTSGHALAEQFKDVRAINDSFFQTEQRYALWRYSQ